MISVANLGTYCPRKWGGEGGTKISPTLHNLDKFIVRRDSHALLLDRARARFDIIYILLFI